MARILVEKIFDPPITQEKIIRDGEIALPCHTAHNVRWIRTLVSRDRRRMICEYEAPDAESVRRSYRKAGLPFVQISTMDVIDDASFLAISEAVKAQTEAAPIH